MASAPPPPVTSTKETTNYARLCRLLVDVGTKILRYTFDKIHPPAKLHSVLAAGTSAHTTIQRLRSKGILNPSQMGNLYPATPSTVSSKNFDITLLVVLLRNICNLKPPVHSGWDKLPSAADTSTEANIARVKYYRNTVYGHASKASVDDATFNSYWQDISNALVALGGPSYGAAINTLKNECMDPDTEEHYRKLLKEWKNDIDNIKDEIRNINEKLDAQKEAEDEDVFDPAELTDRIRQRYNLREGWPAPFPWCEESNSHLGDIFARLKVVSTTKPNVTATADTVNLSWIFNPPEKSQQPRTVLIQGKPGVGEKTFCQKLVSDWATGNQEEDCCPKFLTVLLLRCRDMKSDLWETIDDQLLQVGKVDKRERFVDFIRQNQSYVLLVLDGLDEAPTDKRRELLKIVQGGVLPECRLVAMARNEPGMEEVTKIFDTQLKIEGFTEKEAEEFIVKSLPEDLAPKLLSKLRGDENLKEMAADPLNTALLCLICKELQGRFPQNTTDLYVEIMQFILRRKKVLPEKSNELIEVNKTLLKHLGSIALNGLRKGTFDFEQVDLGSHAEDFFSSFQPEGSEQRPHRRYSFQHKSFQQWFAAFNLCCQLIQEEISPDSLFTGIYAQQLNAVLPFTCGLLAARCEETAVALIKSITTQVNTKTTDALPSRSLLKSFLTACNMNATDLQPLPTKPPVLQRRRQDEDGQDAKSLVLVAFKCINESQVKSSQDLAREFGLFLKLQTLSLQNQKFSVADVIVLANSLKSNTTVTELNLSRSTIGDEAAEGLADALKNNKTLTKLNLSHSAIGDAGTEGLADALKNNKTLKELDLSHNSISEVGAKQLADALKCNTTLTVLNLSDNNIGDKGATCLADALKSNTTLTVLYLSDSNIGDEGATCLVDALRYNKILSQLSLSGNSYIGWNAYRYLSNGLPPARGGRIVLPCPPLL